MIGDDLWRRVGKEPSGSSFNSLVQLEYENGIPRNPLINAGAIVVADMMIDILTNPEKDFLSFIRRLAGDQNIQFDEKVKNSEKDTGFRNVALANFMKSFGNIHNHVDDVLDIYFMMCSVSMSCTQLANAFLFFANHGMIPATHEKILTISQTKDSMHSCRPADFMMKQGNSPSELGYLAKVG